MMKAGAKRAYRAPSPRRFKPSRMATPENEDLPGLEILARDSRHRLMRMP